MYRTSPHKLVSFLPLKYRAKYSDREHENEGIADPGGGPRWHSNRDRRGPYQAVASRHFIGHEPAESCKPSAPYPFNVLMLNQVRPTETGLLAQVYAPLGCMDTSSPSFSLIG